MFRKDWTLLTQPFSTCLFWFPNVPSTKNINQHNSITYFDNGNINVLKSIHQHNNVKNNHLDDLRWSRLHFCE